jgi:hypothetical protein
MYVLAPKSQAAFPNRNTMAWSRTVWFIITKIVKCGLERNWHSTSQYAKGDPEDHLAHTLLFRSHLPALGLLAFNGFFVLLSYPACFLVHDFS